MIILRSGSTVASATEQCLCRVHCGDGLIERGAVRAGRRVHGAGPYAAATEAVRNAADLAAGALNACECGFDLLTALARTGFAEPVPLLRETLLHGPQARLRIGDLENELRPTM
jgi:hypothetical protein